MTAEEKILIDKLVRTESKNDIVDIVKKLVPAATEFTAKLFAYHTEYHDEHYIDKFMDIKNKSERINFLNENCKDCSKKFFEDMLNLIPYMPLNDEERLYRPKVLKPDAPKIENKNLEGVVISNQEWKEMHPVEKYIIHAMSNNPEFDWKSAQDFVLKETEKVLQNSRRNFNKKNDAHKPIENENFFFMLNTLTPYMKRINFFNTKLYPNLNEEEILDMGYSYLFENVKSTADPNYIVRSSISVDFTFAKMAEDYHNEEMRKKYGDDFEPEIFGDIFMKTLNDCI